MRIPISCYNVSVDLSACILLVYLAHGYLLALIKLLVTYKKNVLPVIEESKFRQSTAAWLSLLLNVSLPPIVPLSVDSSISIDLDHGREENSLSFLWFCEHADYR